MQKGLGSSSTQRKTQKVAGKLKSAFKEIVAGSTNWLNVELEVMSNMSDTK